MHVLRGYTADDFPELWPPQDPTAIADWLGAPIALLTSPEPCSMGFGQRGEGGPSMRFVKGKPQVIPIPWVPEVATVSCEFFDRHAITVWTRRDDTGGGYPLNEHMWETLANHECSWVGGREPREFPMPRDAPIPDETHPVVVDGVEQTWPKITRHGMRPWGEVSVVGKRLGRSMVAIVWPAPLREPLVIRMWPEGPDPRPPLVEADDAL